MARAGPILILGPAARPFSYARIIRSLVSRLSHRYDFHQFAFDATEPVPGYEYPIYHNTIAGDAYGVEQLTEIIRRVRPKILWVINDVWLYVAHMYKLRDYAGKIKVILYAPVDSASLNPAHARALEGLSELVLFTQFAERVFRSAVALLKSERRPLTRLPKITLIPHGVDTETFRPYAQDFGETRDNGRAAARRALFPDRRELEDAFIVLNANQNNDRKRIDLTIKGFAIFARGKPANCRLYLHTDVRARGCALLPVARECGIGERLLLSSSRAGAPEFPDRRLNLLYNACDIGLNTSVGEGWGMVAFEHGATGAAQIMPRHSACEELWAGAGVMVEAPEVLRGRHDGAQYFSTTPELVAFALETLYANPDYRRERSRAAYAKATDPRFGWNAIAGRWDALFEETIATPRR